MITQCTLILSNIELLLVCSTEMGRLQARVKMLWKILINYYFIFSPAPCILIFLMMITIRGIQLVEAHSTWCTGQQIPTNARSWSGTCIDLVYSTFCFIYSLSIFCQLFFSNISNVKMFYTKIITKMSFPPNPEDYKDLQVFDLYFVLLLNVLELNLKQVNISPSGTVRS